MKRLAIITTHPIQYYAPIFQLLNQRSNIAINVFYTLGEMQHAKSPDPGFGTTVNWDVPLTEGYPFQWTENTAAKPGTRSFNGIKTPNLINEITSWRPGAVLVVGWAYQSHLEVLRHFKNKIPVYFRGDSTLLTEKRGLRQLLRYLRLTWVYSHVDHAFYVGKNNKAYFKKYGLKESQLSFAPHAIDNHRFLQNREKEAMRFRASFNISDEDILVLFAGKFEPVKNVELLLEAFIMLKPNNTHLLLAGNGVNEENLKNRAKNSEIANRIHFTGFKNQSQMPVLYQAADLFCLPSRSESWGLSINEAMACSRAVLISDSVGCGADLVIEGENGLIFKEGDINSLVDCLNNLTQRKTQLAAYGRKSKELINDWNFLNIAKAIETQLLNEAK